MNQIFKILTLLLIIPQLTSAQDAAAPNFKIYAVDQQRLISLTELTDAVKDTDVLFFGEEHNDSTAHWLQDTIYALLLQKYGTVTLSLEMFETDCQQVLDEYLNDYITESKMTKDARAWGNYQEDYRPMVERAKESGQIVIAANAPRRYVNIVSRKGLGALRQLPKASRRHLPPLPIYTADSSYYKRFQEAMGGAGHNLSDNFFYAQCTWDASMAHRIYRHWRKHKKELVFHLNGRFHTDYQQGTVNQLKRRNKKIDIRNISCLPVEDYDQPDWSKYTTLGNFIIISPAG
ncbi:MAG: ChaN family lipoprotein [Bacteroidota bacterium]